MNKLRILVYASHFYPSVGGMEIVSETLARRFSGAGHSVTVVTDTPSNGPENLPIPVVRRPSFGELLRICLLHDVLLLSPITLRRIGPPLLSGRPIVVKHPNPFVGKNGDVRLVDRLKLGVSRATTNVVAGAYMATLVPNPVIIPNPYDHTLFRYNGEPKTADILFVGRLDVVKGVDVLLRAIKDIESAFPQLNATIVGNGPEYGNLRRLAAELGLDHRVSFAGALRGEALASEMRRHKVMVVPSSYKEPFGNVALQGLASGCLMIVSRNGGLVDATGHHALTFDNGDSESLAACLAEAFREPNLTEKLLGGVQDHLAKHHEDVVANDYLRLLHAVTRRSPSNR